MLKFDPEMRRDFTFDHTYHYWKQLELNQKGSINTWFIYWYAALFLKSGLALFPGKSLVRNIGMDGSGVHSGIDHDYDIEPSASVVNVFPILLAESEEAVSKHETFFRRNMPRHPLHTRIYNKIVRVIKKLGLHIRIAKEGKK